MLKIEIRIVPFNWEHPRAAGQSVLKFGTPVNGFLPLKKDYESAAKQWVENFIAWAAGRHPDQKYIGSERRYKYFWEWGGLPPDEEEYMPQIFEAGFVYQVYETVSNGTPLSPVFKTKNLLIRYLNDFEILEFPVECYFSGSITRFMNVKLTKEECTFLLSQLAADEEKLMQKLQPLLFDKKEDF